MHWLVRQLSGVDPVNTMQGLYEDRQTIMYVNRGIAPQPSRSGCCAGLKLRYLNLSIELQMRKS